MRLSKNVYCFLILSIAALTGLETLCLPSFSHAENSIGIMGGPMIGTDQDLTLKRRDPNGGVIRNEFKNQRADVGPFIGLTFTRWLDSAPFLGVQFDIVYWRNSLEVNPMPFFPRFSLDEEHTAFLGSILARVFVGKKHGVFLYGGPTGGGVLTDISRGGHDFGPAAGAVGGIAWSLTDHLRIRLEARYLITPDVDVNPKHHTRMESSGSRHGKFFVGPHLDTGFVPILVGFDWTFRWPK